MKCPAVKCAVLSLALILATAMGRAQTTVTVGPSGQYPDPCTAFQHLADGDTVQIDANGGVPYANEADCHLTNNNLTVIGVNGRPVISGAGTYTSKGLWDVDGHDIVIDNFEFAYASGQENAAGLRIEDAYTGGGGSGNGGNITVQHSYVHDNGTGILIGNADATDAWYSATPYITFQYDEFVHNGNHDGVGNTHNMYMGFDNSGAMLFTLQYSWSHDSYVGHTVKDRAPNSNILYNLITDEEGNSSYMLDFCLGGNTYVVGNSIYKAAATQGNNNQAIMIFADASDNTSSDPEYGPANQALHFINNTMIDDPANGFPSQFVSISCFNSDNSTCSAPGNGPAETVPAVIENNIFVGPQGNAATNQSSAYQAGNTVLTYSASTLAANFVDWQHFDFHLVSGSPAIGSGIYPPTDNTGAADPKALAVYEHLVPVGIVNRPTPSGSTMDAGAYSYPRSDTPPTLNLNYTTNVTAPGTGTITITGLPTPPTGSYNYASFISSNQAAVPNPPAEDSTTGTITTSFTVNPAVTQTTTVTIDVYAGGAHAVANVTVNPGPPVLSSITQDYNYDPASTVHLEGPAPAGGTVINLSTSDPTYLYAPSTVTVPEGQISAETGSNTGSLWGQSPGSPTETITATQGSVQVSTSYGVFTPGIHACGWDNYGTVVGGNTSPYHVTMRGFFPNSGGTWVFTSDTPSVIPNQTFNFGSGNFDQDVNIVTNPVSTSTVVNVGVNVNGQTTQDNTGQSCSFPITVTPGTPVPPAPTSLVATTASANGINLSWTGSTGTGITYNVYRDSSSTFSPYSANQVATGLSATTYSDTGLVPGTPYYYVIEAVNNSGNSQPSNLATATTTSTGGGTDILAINAGGTAAPPYVADEDFTNNGSQTATVTSPITTSGVVNPAPQAVYQSQRYAQNNANVIYTIPSLTPGTQYIVRLHFAETYFNTAGSRQFDIVINNNTVMTNFDIVASSGGEDVAVVEPFLATADSNGQITISLNNDAANYAAINGIEIQTASSSATAANIVAVSGSGQTANVNSPFANPLVALVTDANNNPVSGATVTFAGSGVSFPGGATAVTGSNGEAQVTAEPTSSGSLSITASVAGVSTPAAFSETGTTAVAAGITAVSGSGQSATVGTPFASPLVVLVTDAHSNPVAGATVTFAGAKVTFPAGATAVTGSNGEAQVSAQPSSTGTLTITASVTGVSTSASFSEQGTAAPKLSSITLSGTGPGTVVHLTAPAPSGGVVVTLSSSDPTIVSAPASVTVPAGASSVATGTLLGSLWSPANSAKTATLTATYNGVTKTLTTSFYSTSLHSFACSPSTCPAVVGGSSYNFSLVLSGTAPVGGGTVQITSDTPAVVPNQTISVAAGQNSPSPNPAALQTNAVATTATVNVTATFNGVSISAGPITVNPPAEIKSVTSDGSNSSGTTVNLTAPAPTGGITVQISVSDPTVVSAPATVTVPAGQTSAEIGTLTASVWSPANTSKSATISASFNSVTKTLTKTFSSPGIASFTCTESPCPTVVGGNSITANVTLSHPAPAGGVTVQISSNNQTVVPSQTVTIAAGQLSPASQPVALSTTAVTKNTNVQLTAAFNGTTHTLSGGPVTITPPAPPASVAAVSGGGQSANTGTNFTNPLVVVVDDANGNPVNNVTVTFAGSGVSFPNGATAITNSSGQAQVTAQPTNSGSLTITASVSGVSTPATFSETGTAPVSLTSVTMDSPYNAGTTVHLSGPATSPVVVNLSSSDTSVLYVPATVTVPTGQSSAETGSYLGSWWGQSPSQKPATVTAVYNGVTQTMTANYLTPGIHGFGCNYSPCSVAGGSGLGVTFEGTFGGAPEGGGSIQVVSDTPSVIPNQSYNLTAGQGSYVPFNITTNAVSTTTTVTINVIYNGQTYWAPQSVTVNP